MRQLYQKQSTPLCEDMFEFMSVHQASFNEINPSLDYPAAISRRLTANSSDWLDETQSTTHTHTHRINNSCTVSLALSLDIYIFPSSCFIRPCSCLQLSTIFLWHNIISLLQHLIGLIWPDWEVQKACASLLPNGCAMFYETAEQCQRQLLQVLLIALWPIWYGRLQPGFVAVIMICCSALEVGFGLGRFIDVISLRRQVRLLSLERWLQQLKKSVCCRTGRWRW